MAKITLIFAGLLIALGLAGYLGTGSAHPTALIPMWIGIALGILGLLAISPNEVRRKLFMHVNVTIGLLGFLGAAGEIARTLISSKPLNPIAFSSKSALAVLLLIYVLLCVRSFIAVRRAGKA